MELLSGLSERLREGNILLGSVQQRLALTGGNDGEPSEPIKEKSAAPAKPQKGSAASQKTAKPKRGFLSRLFR